MKNIINSHFEGVLTNSDQLIINFGKLYGTKEGKRNTQIFNKKIFNPGKIANSRILNHWEKEGVIEDERPDKKGWRTYSAIEIFWIHIVFRLRKFNFSLNQILLLKKSLETYSDSIEISKMPILEMYVRYTLINFVPFYLIVEADGRGHIGFESEIEEHKRKGFLANHICINLNDIMLNTFPKANLKLDFEVNWNLNQSESDLVTMIRTGRFKSIEVVSSNGEIKMFNAVEIIREKSLFRELANNYAFQDINTKYRNYKMVAIERKIKIKY